MQRPIVVVTDSPFPNLDPARKVLSNINAVIRLVENSTPDGIAEATQDADGVLVTYAKIGAEAIRQMKRCRIISRFGIGVDNVDISAATDAGIVVTRVPDYCIDEVSDHTLALLLAVARKIPLYFIFPSFINYIHLKKIDIYIPSFTITFPIIIISPCRRRRGTITIDKLLTSY